MTTTGYQAETLPRGWSWQTFGDICFPDRVIVEPDTQRARELVFVGLEDIESVTGRVLRDPRSKPVQEGTSTSFHFNECHVLYSKLRPYLNKVALPDFEGRCTTELIPLRPHPGVSREYLAWLLRRPQTVESAMREKTGARMPRADLRHILSLPIPVPPSLEEQSQVVQKMARCLNLVSQAKSILQQQENLLDAYLQKSLSDFPCGILP